MDYLSQYTNCINKSSKKTVITIGNFDGLHLAHQMLISKTIAFAKEQDYHSLALVLSPHPYELLTGQSLKKLTTVSDRKQLIETMGIDECLILDFTFELAQYSAADFCQKILLDRLNLTQLVVGYDFRMGSKKYTQSLEDIAKNQNFLLTRLQAKSLENEEQIISSSNIRQDIQNGNIAHANLMLGRNYSLSGEIIHGFDRGGKILGIATANILNDELIIPQKAVYQSLVQINHSPKKYPALTNIGTNPSFNNEKVSIESHILDFNENIYDQILTVEFIKKIRDEKKFASLDELKSQILCDIESVRKS